jgi:uncharacterized protein GlcG (DUF336 family)
MHGHQPAAGAFRRQAAFTDKLVSKIKQLKVGSGMDPKSEIGPLATRKQLETVLRYVDIGKSEAKHLHGGERLKGDAFDHGYYVAPAVFTDVAQTMRIAREEIFGPVLAIIEVSSYDDAIAKANDTEYGLSAAIVTKNPRYMHRFAQDIQAGTVKINRTTTGNLVNAPFGGLKRSSTSTFRESAVRARVLYADQDRLPGAMKATLKLELKEALAMAQAAVRKAEEIGVRQTVCVVDDGGYPIALQRMDGARITGPQIAWNKAFTAAGHKRSTHLFTTPPNGPALPGNEAFGIQLSFEGRFAAFVGGFPVVVDGEVIGGVGLSGGNGEQDTKCALAALQALQDLAGSKHSVLVEPDIKK